MEWLLVIFGGVFSIICILFLMGLFSSSGTSYEEAIAQQRKATTELLALADNKPKKNKKSNKKLAKKEKKESTTTTGSDPESEAPAESGVDEDITVAKPHVEFCPPIVVDVPAEPQPAIKIRKRGSKDPKVKPILINKEDPSCISDPTTPLSSLNNTVSNHFEEIHPKDEFELLQSTLAAEKKLEKKEDAPEKKEAKPAKQAKGAKAAVKQPQVVEIPKEELILEKKSVSDGPKEQRKGKKSEKKMVSDDSVQTPVEDVIPPLNPPEPTELTTEKLLKHALTSASAAPVTTSAAPAASPAGGKNKKKKQEPNVISLMAGDSSGVNVGELVRVVREAALSRSEIQILTDTLLNKQHDPLPEHSEWTEGPNDPIQKMKKQLADKEKALTDEIEASQALHAKLKELRASLNAERARASSAVRAQEQAAATTRAELHTLQTRLQRLLEDNQALAQEKFLLQSKLSAEEEVQAQRVQMEMHIQRLSESEAALVQQLAALQAELNARVLEAGQARCEAGAARDNMLMAQQHAMELAQQLQEANNACNNLEQQRAAAAHAEQLAQQELHKAQDRINALSDLQNEVQKLTTRAQTAEATTIKVKEEMETQKKQLLDELGQLREQLALRESELAEVKQLKVAPSQNGLPPSTNIDQQKAAELAKVESVVESLRSELATAQLSSREQREQLAQMQAQLKQYQDKNNEAIAKAQEAQYKEVMNVLRAACPAAVPSSVADGARWLHIFADNLQKQLQKKPEKEILKDSSVDDLTAQNEHLQGLVDKYKRIINDTEGVLSRLQQNVSSEEARWSQQLAEKQRELDEMKQRTLTQMQNKIDTLQVELQKAQLTNHNHSFADAERLAEERLLTGFSEKHKTEVRNGPSQVGLDEI